MSEKKQFIVVLGMHRSGTSMLTAGLAHGGIHVGCELMGAGKGNIKGHWEDNDIVALNNRVLDELNIKWDTLGEINPQLLFDSKDSLIEEARALLRSKVNSADEVFAFKDPRTLRLFPFWRRVFEGIDASVHYIFGFRNPVDVCESLNKRDGKSYIYSQLLWLHHNLDSFSEIVESNSRLSFLDFYELCKSPTACISRIFEEIGITPNLEGLELFEREFYDNALVSKMTDPYQISADKRISPICFDAYRALRGLSNSVFNNCTVVETISESWKLSSSLLNDQLGLFEKEQEEFSLVTSRKIKSLNSKVARLEAEVDIVEYKLGKRIAAFDMEDIIESLSENLLSTFYILKNDILSENRTLCKFQIAQEQKLNKVNNVLGDINQRVIKEAEEFKNLQFNLSNVLLDYKRELTESVAKNEKLVKSNLELSNELNKERLRNKELVKQKQEILSSISWKVTSPIRSILSFFLK